MKIRVFHYITPAGSIVSARLTGCPVKSVFCKTRIFGSSRSSKGPGASLSATLIRSYSRSSSRHPPSRAFPIPPSRQNLPCAATSSSASFRAGRSRLPLQKMMSSLVVKQHPAGVRSGSTKSSPSLYKTVETGVCLIGFKNLIFAVGGRRRANAADSVALSNAVEPGAKRIRTLLLYMLLPRGHRDRFSKIFFLRRARGTARVAPGSH